MAATRKHKASQKKKHGTKKHSKGHKSSKVSRSRAGMERDAEDLSALFGNLGFGTARAVDRASRGVLSATEAMGQGVQGAAQGLGQATSSLARGALGTGQALGASAAQAARGTAQFGVDLGNTVVPQFVPGRNVFSMGDLASSLPGSKKKGPKGASARSTKMQLDERQGSRKSGRTRTTAKRYSPGAISKSKKRTAAQKAAILKGKRTRALNARRGFKNTAARRSAAAKKGLATKASNRRFNTAAKDMRAALDELF